MATVSSHQRLPDANESTPIVLSLVRGEKHEIAPKTTLGFKLGWCYAESEKRDNRNHIAQYADAVWDISPPDATIYLHAGSHVYAKLPASAFTKDSPMWRVALYHCEVVTVSKPVTYKMALLSQQLRREMCETEHRVGHLVYKFGVARPAEDVTQRTAPKETITLRGEEIELAWIDPKEYMQNLREKTEVYSTVEDDYHAHNDARTEHRADLMYDFTPGTKIRIGPDSVDASCFTKTRPLCASAMKYHDIIVPNDAEFTAVVLPLEQSTRLESGKHKIRVGALMYYNGTVRGHTGSPTMTPDDFLVPETTFENVQPRWLETTNCLEALKVHASQNFATCLAFRSKYVPYWPLSRCGDVSWDIEPKCELYIGRHAISSDAFTRDAPLLLNAIPYDYCGTSVPLVRKTAILDDVKRKLLSTTKGALGAVWYESGNAVPLKYLQRQKL